MREIKQGKLLTPIALNSWVLIVPQGDRMFANSFTQTLKRVGPSLGMSIADPDV